MQVFVDQAANRLALDLFQGCRINLGQTGRRDDEAHTIAHIHRCDRLIIDERSHALCRLRHGTRRHEQEQGRRQRHH